MVAAPSCAADDCIIETRGLTKEFKRLRRGLQRRPARAPRAHPCADRPERRRQDDLLQPADQVPRPDPRPDPVPRRGHHACEAGRGGAPRHRALVPDLGGLPAPDGARERARRPAAHTSARLPFLEARGDARGAQRPRAWSCSSWSTSAPSPPWWRSSCPMAASARWRSPPRSRMDPQLMLLDEPTQGMGHEDVDRVTALIKQAAAKRTVLMVEHNMNVVARIADTITVLQRGQIIAERHATPRCRATRRSSRPTWAPPTANCGARTDGRGAAARARPARLLRRVAHPARRRLPREPRRGRDPARAQRRRAHHDAQGAARPGRQRAPARSRSRGARRSSCRRTASRAWASATVPRSAASTRSLSAEENLLLPPRGRRRAACRWRRSTPCSPT